MQSMRCFIISTSLGSRISSRSSLALYTPSVRETGGTKTEERGEEQRSFISLALLLMHRVARVAKWGPRALRRSSVPVSRLRV